MLTESGLGRPLADVIREQGRLPATEVIRIALQVLEALTSAHAVGVVHQNLTTSTVLLRPDGTAVLSDFGGPEGNPETAGCPEFLAPERANGGRATPATDLWALGCLIYTAVEGRSPFAREDTMSTLHAIVTEKPPIPGGPLAPVLRGLLAKRTTLRFSVETARLMLRAAAASPELTPARWR